jgi:hypothetical protein
MRTVTSLLCVSESIAPDPVPASVRPHGCSVSDDSRVASTPSPLPSHLHTTAHDTHPMPTLLDHACTQVQHVVHGFFRNRNLAFLANSARPIDYSVPPTPCPCSSLTHVHRFMFFLCNRNLALLANSAKPIDYTEVFRDIETGR